MRNKLSVAVLCVALGLSSAVRADDAPASQPAAAAEPVAYAKLKDALPKTLGPLKIGKATGQKTAMGAMKMSQAEAPYAGPNADAPPSGQITVIDYGGMPGMLEGMSAWTKMALDTDNDEESTKTGALNGYPMMETFRKEPKSAQILVVVAKRFLVTITTEGLPLDAVRAAAGKIDFKAFEAAAKG